MTSYHLREIDARLRGACQIWPVSPCVPVFVSDEQFGRTVLLRRHKNGFDVVAEGESGNAYTLTPDGRCGCRGYTGHGHCYHSSALAAVGFGDELYRLLMVQEATAAGICMSVDREQSRQREAVGV